MNRKIFKWEDLSVLGENKDVDCICGYVCSCKPV